MAGYSQKENMGTMFKNENKSSPSYPDYSGPINVNGVDMYISGWVKTAGPTARNPGSKFLSLQIQESTKNKATNQGSGGKKTDPYDDYEDDIPF